jgi:hypothetical protein
MSVDQYSLDFLIQHQTKDVEELESQLSEQKQMFENQVLNSKLRVDRLQKLLRDVPDKIHSLGLNDLINSEFERETCDIKHAEARVKQSNASLQLRILLSQQKLESLIEQKNNKQ